jgi:general stress protein 26
MENLSKRQTLRYLKDKIKNIRTAMLTTYTNANGYRSRPMGTADIDNSGNIWFFTNEYSPQNKEVFMDNTVSVTYSNPDNDAYVSVRGEAELISDRQKMKEFWNPFAKAFFPNGINDPKLTLIRIKPTNAEYWDSSSIKLFVL